MTETFAPLGTFRPTDNLTERLIANAARLVEEKYQPRTCPNGPRTRRNSQGDHTGDRTPSKPL